jgi:GT2 family glycosyltransferase
VDGKFLRVDGARFWIRGVCYGSFPPNEAGEPFPSLIQVREDFARMRGAGVNTVRIYSPPPDRIADAAWKAGLRLIPDIMWGSRYCELDDPDRVRFIRGWVREHSRRLAGHPAILMYSIGNEIPPLLVRWYGRHRIENHLRALHDIVKEQAAGSLVTYVCHPPTEHLELPFLDVVSYNVFLERERDFRAYLARLHSLAGDRPVFLAELGLDSRRHGEQAQADFLDRFLRACLEKGLCGASVFSWTDEWGIFDDTVEGWGFGLTDAERRPRPALSAVRNIYQNDPYKLRREGWPRVSVIVATHNGARSLDWCLSGLDRLRYPDYEVLLVDDGSSDSTPAIAARHRVRYLRQAQNGGLSRARNAGIAAATGSIIAFTDDDAQPDPDWLFYLVSTMEEHQAAACGGPNLPPPREGFIAQCVAFAPGNPTQVLLTDEVAEHIPGCNMAFRASALERIGGFDVTHRAAGDDLDVCWKLQVRGEQVVFSPAALVWHKRRGTIRAFLRQQRGYGFAEAHLRRQYPGRFNVAGYPVWRGRIYDLAPRFWVPEWFPFLGPRIYQGRFGSAPYQSLYQPGAAWWAGLLAGPEWLLLCLSLGLAAWFTRGSAPAIASALGGLAIAFGAGALLTAGLAAWGATARSPWRRSRRVFGRALVTLLYVAQPLARAWGRWRGWWPARQAAPDYGAEERFYGNLEQRDGWLHHLWGHLDAAGWRVEAGSPWGRSDLEVRGPGPWRVTLVSVAEENLERGEYAVRFRLTARMKPGAIAAAGVLLAGASVLAFLPGLLPLGLPIGITLWWLLFGSRRHLVAAVSQLALECAEARGMPRVA